MSTWGGRKINQLLFMAGIFVVGSTAHGQTFSCVQSGDFDICPTGPAKKCDDRICQHLGVPPIMAPDRYLAPVTHPAFAIDRSAPVPWELDPTELNQLLKSGKYRVVHYDLNPGHAGGSGSSIGPKGFFSPTRFSQAPINLADDESVFRIAVNIPDNKVFYAGPKPGETKQIYIPQLIEINGVDQAGTTTHFTQFRGFNGTGKGHYIYVDVLIQKVEPAFVKRDATHR